MFSFIQKHVVSDSIWHITTWELIIRLTLATILGGLIGMEREWNNHPAGFRTHIMVCLGSATLMSLSIYGFSAFVYEYNVRIDPARLAAQVVSGIGFLGAGAILRNGNIVKGLTTASSIWVVAAIGLCVGAGFYTGSLYATFIALISLHFFNKWEKRWLNNRSFHEIEMIVNNAPGTLGAIIHTFAEYGIQIKNLKMNPTDNDIAGITGEDAVALDLQLICKNPLKLAEACERIAAMEVAISLDTGQFVNRKSASTRED